MLQPLLKASTEWQRLYTDRRVLVHGLWGVYESTVQAGWAEDMALELLRIGDIIHLRSSFFTLLNSPDTRDRLGVSRSARYISPIIAVPVRQTSEGLFPIYVRMMEVSSYSPPSLHMYVDTVRPQIVKTE